MSNKEDMKFTLDAEFWIPTNNFKKFFIDV
jgi:hypothetical protein